MFNLQMLPLYVYLRLAFYSKWNCLLLRRQREVQIGNGRTSYNAQSRLYHPRQVTDFPTSLYTRNRLEEGHLIACIHCITFWHVNHKPLQATYLLLALKGTC
jgi:hypothetical protein